MICADTQLYISLFAVAYRPIRSCINACMHLCAGLYAAVYRHTYSCIYAYIPLNTDLHALVYRPTYNVGLYAALFRPIYSHGKTFLQVYEGLSSHGRKTWVTEAEQKSRKLHGNCFEEFCLRFKIFSTDNNFKTNFRKYFPNTFRNLSHGKVFSRNCLELFWIFPKIVKSRKTGLKSRKRGLKSRKRTWVTEART